MPVNIVENWAEVFGRVRGLEHHDAPSGFVEVGMEVLRVRSIEGFPNLLEDTAGKAIDVFLPQEVIEEMQISREDVLDCWVRKAGQGRYFVHREQVHVEPPDPPPID